MTALADQYRAATAEARALINAALPATIGVPPTRKPGWVTKVLDQRAADPRCSHLDRRPIQPAFAFIWERQWRCKPRHSEFGGRQLARMRAGIPWLDVAEDNTCDRCRARVGDDNLTPTILQGGMFVVHAAVCPRCERRLEREGGRVLAA